MSVQIGTNQAGQAVTPHDRNLPQVTLTRNTPMPLDLDWPLSVQANTSAIERRAATLPARRSLSILRLAGKASIRRRPVNSALGSTMASNA